MLQLLLVLRHNFDITNESLVRHIRHACNEDRHAPTKSGLGATQDAAWHNSGLRTELVEEVRVIVSVELSLLIRVEAIEFGAPLEPQHSVDVSGLRDLPRHLERLHRDLQHIRDGRLRRELNQRAANASTKMALDIHMYVRISYKTCERV